MLSYMLEAAADTRFNVRTPKRCHLAQLPGDLDGFVEQQTELPLVARVTGWRHLAEEIFGGVQRGENKTRGNKIRMREWGKKSENVGDIEKKSAGINRDEGRKSDGMKGSGRKRVVKCVYMQVGAGWKDRKHQRNRFIFKSLCLGFPVPGCSPH